LFFQKKKLLNELESLVSFYSKLFPPVFSKPKKNKHLNFFIKIILLRLKQNILKEAFEGIMSLQLLGRVWVGKR